MDAILFDWDGTLADTLGSIYRANVEVMAALGLPFDPAIYRRHFAPDWRVMYDAPRCPGRPARGGERALVGGPRRDRHGPLPGRARDARAAGRRRSPARDRDRRAERPGRRRAPPATGSSGCSGRSSTATTARPRSPTRPRSARPSATLGVADRPSASIYVGDTPDDMRMAVAAGVRAVGIESVLGDAAELRAAGATETAATTVEWARRRFADPDRPAAAAAG